MNNSELAKNLEHLAESTRLLDQLVRMPRERVDQLLHLLSDPAAAAALVRLLQSVRELQERHRSIDYPASQAPPKLSPEVRSTATRDLVESLRPLLEEMFSDRERFPSTKSIADFVSEVFKLNVPYQRVNRERYIQRVVSAVKRSPRAIHHVRNFVDGVRMDPRDAAYATLYNFIRGRSVDE